ncbi:MAG: hypothetical protein ABFS37_09150 [Acidobacteriota bacterium]
MIRTRIEPAQILVGQKANLSVDVMTKTWFLEAPAFPDVLDVADAIVVPPGPFGVNSSQVIDGERYAVQTKRYSIIPTGVGIYRIPSFEVPLVVAREDASRSTEIRLKTRELQFEGRVPEAAEGLGLVVSARGMKFRQDWSRSLDDLKVGDSVTRTVTGAIEDSVPMLLPNPGFSAPAGVGVYPERPVFDEARDRGEMRGSRVDRVVYTLEAEGSFDLPEIVVHWWDLKAGKLRREGFPEVHLEVAANPDLVVESFGPEEVEAQENELEKAAENAGYQGLWRLVFGLTIFGALLWLLRHRLRAFWRAWAVRRGGENEEKRRFKNFTQTARRGDASETVTTLIAWLDAWWQGDEPAGLGVFAAWSGDVMLEEQLGALEVAAFAPSPDVDSWSPATLVKRVAAVRRRALRNQERGAEVSSGLAVLNPRSRS